MLKNEPLVRIRLTSINVKLFLGLHLENQINFQLYFSIYSF